MAGDLIINLTTTPATPVDAIFRGQRDSTGAPGPTEASADVFSPYGTPLATTSSTKIYVDAAATGAGDGTSLADAFTTVQAAVDTATAGDVIVVKGGKYRESVELKSSGTEASPIVLTRYGTERPVITGALELTGWTACTDQADALGSPNWANCYKAFVPATSAYLESGINKDNGVNLGLLQDGTPLRLAINAPGFTDASLSTAEKLNRAFNRKNDAWYFTGGSGNATTLTNAAAAAEYTSYAADLVNAYALAHWTQNNNVDMPKITGLSGNVFSIETSQSTHDGDMAILNAGVDLVLPGSWCFKDAVEGDNTRKVVVYPRNGEDLSAAEATIEYCDKRAGLVIRDRNWWTMYGIDAYGYTGNKQFRGTAFGSGQNPSGFANNGQDNEGIIVEECDARYCMSTDAWAAGFKIDGAKKCSIINCTAFEIEGQGIGIFPSAGGGVSNDNLIYANSVSRMHVGGIRPHTQLRCIVAYNEITDIVSSHANGASIYESARDVLVHGNIIRTQQGIGFTHQRTTNAWFLFNDIQSPPGDPSGRRGLEDNSRNEEEIDGTRGVIVYLNTTSGPASTSATGGTAISGGRTARSDHYILNNVAHGGIDPSPANTEAVRIAEASVYSGGNINDLKDASYNVLTADTNYSAAFLSGQSYFAGTSPNFYDQLPLLSNNSLETTLADVFVDVNSGNYKPVASGPLDGTGVNPSTHPAASDLLPDLTGWYHSGYDYQRDVLGNAVTWSDMPIGAYLA